MGQSAMKQMGSFSGHVNKETADQLWNKYDTDGSGQMTREEATEFVNEYCRIHLIENHEAVLQTFFEVFDANKDGRISKLEVMGRYFVLPQRAAVEPIKKEPKTKAANSKSNIDKHLTMSPPLDFSWQGISTLADYARLEPNRSPLIPVCGNKDRTKPPATADSSKKRTGVNNTPREEPPDADSSPPLNTGLKLANNSLRDLNHLDLFVNHFFVAPESTVRFIDLSFNELPVIPEILFNFPNLEILYLHHNFICNIAEVYKLRRFTHLTKLTLNANCANQVVPEKKQSPSAAAGAAAGEKKKAASSAVAASSKSGGSSGPATTTFVQLEDTPNYRLRVIWMLRNTQLKNLDNGAVTPTEREKAAHWAATYRTPAQKAKEVDIESKLDEKVRAENERYQAVLAQARKAQEEKENEDNN